MRKADNQVTEVDCISNLHAMILEFKCDTSQNRVGSLITEIFLTLIYTSLAKSMHSYFLPFLHELCLVIYRCTCARFCTELKAKAQFTMGYPWRM